MTPDRVTAPDVIDVPRYAAERRIRVRELVPIVVDRGNPAGRVVAQDPAADTLMAFGEPMTIWLRGRRGPEGGDREPWQPLPDPLVLSGEAFDE
jgi:hypothetical protein